MGTPYLVKSHRLVKTNACRQANAVCNERKATLKCTQTQDMRVNQSSLRLAVFKVAAICLDASVNGSSPSGLTAAAGQADPMQTQCAQA